MREWFIQNIRQDEKEEDNRLRLLIGAINPKVLKELEKPTMEDIIAKMPQQAIRVMQAVNEDERVMQSIQKYKKLKNKWEKEEEISLNPNEDIDGGSNS